MEDSRICPMLGGRLCEGVGCMMYRHTPELHRDVDADIVEEKVAEGWSRVEGAKAEYGYHMRHPGVAYCGLAGPPTNAPAMLDRDKVILKP